MSYLVFCTFDLKNPKPGDYDTAYAELSKLGLSRVVTTDSKGKVIIPTTSAMGQLTGASAKEVRDDILRKVRAAFAAKRLTSEIFVVVGGDWAWAAGST